MIADRALHRLREPRWRKGFVNVLRKENRDWWHTRRWVIHLVIWLVLVNLAVAAPLWLQPSQPPDGASLTAEEQQQWIENNRIENRVQQAIRTLLDASGVFLLVGVVIVMQNAIIDEKSSGTSAWIFSKPVARSSFILAKLVANGGALLLLAVVVQWVLAYVQISIAAGGGQPIVPYLLCTGLLALNLLFWLTLTLMLGTFFTNRAVVLAVPLGVLFVLMIITSRVTVLLDFTPLAFIMDMPEKRSLAQLAMQGQPLATITPIIMTLVWCALFVGVAIWRFGREEF